MIGPLGVIPVSRLRRAPGITATRLADPGAAGQDNTALLSDEAAAGEVIDERRIARRARELKVIEATEEVVIGGMILVPVWPVKFPVAAPEFPVLPNEFPVLLHREFG